MRCVSLARMEAKKVFYSGRVQGVGFRCAAKQLAAEFDVSGWVRNLPDGRVEMLVIAADAEELEAFLTELQENSEVANCLTQKEIINIAPPSGLKGFFIGLTPIRTSDEIELENAED